MPPLRVWINYEPRIYTDIFKEIFRSMQWVEVVDEAPADPGCKSSGEDLNRIDVVMFSLDRLDQSRPELTPEFLQHAKVLAFSPSGDFGLRRMPGRPDWEEVRPFGLNQLIDELKVG